jgi:hypothetical protein
MKKMDLQLKNGGGQLEVIHLLGLSSVCRPNTSKSLGADETSIASYLNNANMSDSTARCTKYCVHTLKRGQQ